jgi:hypothetical protein
MLEDVISGGRNTEHTKMTQKTRGDWVTTPTRWSTGGTNCHVLKNKITTLRM